MIFGFIEAHQQEWPVTVMCDILQVSTAGYYAWRHRPVSAGQQRRDRLSAEIRLIHDTVKGRYGSPRVHAELAARAAPCSVNTVAKLMRAQGIAAKTARKFRHTTDSNHDLPVADNLLERAFDPAVANTVWAADFTFIPTRKAGSTSRPSRTSSRGASWAGR